MKYIAILILAILGMVELTLKVILTICTCFLLFAIVPFSFYNNPWCFKMAEKVLNS